MSLEIFLTHFYKEYNEINESLNKLTKIDESNGNESELKLKLSSDYELISNRTEILQKYFTDNTAFIPNYEIRKAQEHLAKLKRLSQDKRDEIFPKKKFGFKSKQKMTTLENTIETTQSDLEKKATQTTEFNPIFTENSCTIKDTDNANIIKLPSEINSKDIGIVNVKNSCIQLLGNPSVMHGNNIENSTILCGPISGSGLFYKMKNVKLVIGCHQLRIHDSYDCQFYIHLGSRAIIENCSNVKFAPYSWTYPNIEDHFTKSGLDPNQSNYTNVDDFNFLKLNQKSPNWSFLEENERIKWTTNEKNELNSQN